MIQVLNLSNTFSKIINLGKQFFFFFKLLGLGMKALGNFFFFGLGHGLGPNHGIASGAHGAYGYPMDRVWS